MSRYEQSLDYVARARKVTPGAAQTLSKMPARFPHGAFPTALSRARGACVVDIDGHQYVDWICGLGAVTLGYNYTGFGQCLDDALRKYGTGTLSLPCEMEAELAERLCEKIPCAEMVRFVNSGSEATEAAIRTARIATGRDLILTVKGGYHSWHSWFQAVKDWHPGVPHAYTQVVHGLPYNDLVAWQQSFEMCDIDGYNVAAVIMEPCLFEKPLPGFLEGVRELCSKYGALLIFDEMVTGYRWALAGGQEYFGVTPDLATYGKGMANGLPIGMLCGKREYMQHAELISGTFGGNAISLSAANYVLDAYEDSPVIDTMWKRGKELQDFVNEQCQRLNILAVADGYACKPRVRFTTGDTDTDLLAISLLLQECASNGILLHYGGLNVCNVLTDEDMKVTFRALNISLKCVKGCIESNDWSLLHGEKIQPVVTVRTA